ncbi:uncharacterized protein IL334_004627 [Kwoniella shivajii]|uniref:DUF1311 domain-containing protein n=1 Tax=Kwoniella shivajii TaxID=564305 RepID=A0ABZ1D2M0_9TREE|nr:hypothetical protein IL334_004627 [Kwoniella shivajii]
MTSHATITNITKAITTTGDTCKQLESLAADQGDTGAQQSAQKLRDARARWILASGERAESEARSNFQTTYSDIQEVYGNRFAALKLMKISQQ